eukprot:symbB.v1.2.028032.t1/scaffold2926.1/size67079/5
MPEVHLVPNGFSYSAVVSGGGSWRQGVEAGGEFLVCLARACEETSLSARSLVDLERKESFEEVEVQGYGPGGAALIIEAMTDNMNRTRGAIKDAFKEVNGEALGKIFFAELQRRFCVATASDPVSRHAIPLGLDTLLPAPRDAGLTYFGTAVGADLGAVMPGHAGQYYQRVLPAAQAGTMESFFFLAEQFRTQDEPTFCGLTTLAMVLNSLRIDPMRTWKGAWRWYNEQNLACCFGPERVRAEGLSFDMFSSLARCNGAEDEKAAFITDFRAAVKAVSQSRERECLVVCYTREVLGQTGAGHFSPIGGYHEETDSVLIMDVARFKYPPHWVPLMHLADAMLKMDPITGKPRGFLHLHLQMRSAWQGAPFRVPFAFAAKLFEMDSASGEVQCPLPTSDTPHVVLMRRWLSAVGAVEPQVWGQLLQVFSRLALYKPFMDFCKAYDEATQHFCGAEFPPLRFQASSGARKQNGNPELTLWSCGELWVLISSELASAGLAKGVALAIRGPWALVLEAQRETLLHILPPPRECRGSVGQ